MFCLAGKPSYIFMIYASQVSDTHILTDAGKVSETKR